MKIKDIVMVCCYRVEEDMKIASSCHFHVSNDKIWSFFFLFHAAFISVSVLFLHFVLMVLVGKWKKWSEVKCWCLHGFWLFRIFLPTVCTYSFFFKKNFLLAWCLWNIDVNDAISSEFISNEFFEIFIKLFSFSLVFINKN